MAMRFYIEVEGKRLLVVLHERQSGLVRAANRYYKANWSDAAACFQEPMTEDIWGVIRLCKEEFSLGVLAHEAVHAAAYISRTLPSRNPDLRTVGDIPDEEDFADLVEKIVDRSWTNLVDN